MLIMKSHEELTDEFNAVSDDGQQFHMVELTTLIDTSSLSNPSGTLIKGLKRICTSDGKVCNAIDKNTFIIVDLDLQVKRI